MLFRAIADRALAQTAYLVGCPATGEALVVDPERDIDRYLDAAARENLRVTAVAETHVHADFLSGAQALAEATGARLYLSAEGGAWRAAWADRTTAPVTWLHDGDAFHVGNLTLDVLHTPGHTPEHIAFLVTDRGRDAPMGLISGDLVFVGDMGRPDLLESAVGERGASRDAARHLFASAQRVLALPDYVQVWPGHGAGSACGKALGDVPQTTLGYERRFNAALAAASGDAEAFADAVLDGQAEPPLYFARMKRLNRDGVPPLAALPRPERLAPADVPAGATVIDTRADRRAFAAAHLPGALFVPFDRQFASVAASLVADPESPLVLVIPDADIDAAVRALLRVGLDRVVGVVSPDSLTASGQATASFEAARFADVDVRPDDVVVDVRRGSERAAGAVAGSVHAPHLRLPEALGRLPRGRRLVVHCQSGVRSALASAFLAREGFQVVYVDDVFANAGALGRPVVRPGEQPEEVPSGLEPL